MAASDESPRRSGFTFEQLVLRFGVFVMILALITLALWTRTLADQVTVLRAQSAAAAAPAAAAPIGSPETRDVLLKEMAVVPATIEVPAGTPLTLKVTNHGQVAHNLTIAGGPATPMLKPHTAAYRLDVGVVQKPMTAYCSVPGHREAGMTLAINVKGVAAATARGHRRGGGQPRRRQARRQRHPAGRLAATRPGACAGGRRP